jgi:adenylate cyclase
MKVLSSPRLSSQLTKIFWITVSWNLVAMMQFYLGYNVIQQFGCEIPDHPPLHFLAASLVTGLLAGTLGGSMVVFLWEKWLRTINYGRTLFYMFLTFTATFVFVGYAGGIIVHSLEMKRPFWDGAVFSSVTDHFTETGQLFSYLFWLIVVLITMIVFQVNDKYGPGVFKDFLLGKYFHPRREERIFMFLDMRSSTAIAEQLGEMKYFNLVRDVFSDATAPIIYSKGEIYQYVGDEIVISWKMKNGLENANCLNCFFEIQKTLKRKAPEYQKKYGVTPEFKAGIHYGHVMAGEVGVVKRDIAFSGDVLNTTARIQSKCNELGVNILFSKFLLERLPQPTLAFKPIKIGDMNLRGKQEPVVLYTV